MLSTSVIYSWAQRYDYSCGYPDFSPSRVLLLGGGGGAGGTTSSLGELRLLVPRWWCEGGVKVLRLARYISVIYLGRSVH